MFIERLDLFSLPVWTYRYPDFEKYQQKFIEYLSDDKHYFNGLATNGLTITEGNLHTSHPTLFPIRDFIQTCYEDVMDKMGYEKQCGITSMWATRQIHKGSLHEHMHSNAFLACVFYIYDLDGTADGTTFTDHNRNLYQIQPRIKHDTNLFFSTSKSMKFEVGTCIVFPSWALHKATPTDSRYRIIIGANSMPIGRSNGNHYQQYEYQDPKNTKFLLLDDHISDGYKLKTGAITN